MDRETSEKLEKANNILYYLQDDFKTDVDYYARLKKIRVELIQLIDDVNDRLDTVESLRIKCKKGGLRVPVNTPKKKEIV